MLRSVKTAEHFFDVTTIIFMFIAFECFARRVVIIGDKNYPKVHFRGVFSGN